MRDPKPVGLVFFLALLAALLGLMYVLSLPPELRYALLVRVMAVEGVASAPPQGLLEQCWWLTAHRQAQVWAMTGLLALAVLMGSVEGALRRSVDVRGGFLLAWWTLGLLLLALALGLVAAYLVVPWPVPSRYVSLGLGAVLLVGSYGVVAGRPYVP